MLFTDDTRGRILNNVKRLDVMITIIVIVIIIFALTHQQAAREIFVPLVRKVR